MLEKFINNNKKRHTQNPISQTQRKKKIMERKA
jgi:hypothetical protein